MKDRTGKRVMDDRYWPTGSRLIVVEGEPGLVDQWLDAVQEQHAAARDVIDCWDGQGDWQYREHLADAVEHLRFALYQVRQWEVRA